ncbi:MAG: uracil phosphoribosyltransferase [Bifidobacteriaceae bacterium]|jgi:uracil phosphoribosyltransferase|nr:uracil phosphoribosyltransferase [Bifidobacteriaceae bacterium]
MKLIVPDHPLVLHKISLLRDKRTPSPIFRQLVDELMTLLAYEATRNTQLVEKRIDTPVAQTVGQRMKEPHPIIVPILRAGLGMVNGMSALLPNAEIGFLGMKRDEETLKSVTYANRLPDNLTGRTVYIVDPMLATGGTLVSAIEYVLERGAKNIICVCLLGSPEGVKFVEENKPAGVNLTTVLGAMDEKLNEKGYIVPGLGDAGDRLYGVVDL